MLTVECFVSFIFDFISKNVFLLNSNAIEQGVRMCEAKMTVTRTTLSGYF